MNRRVFDDHYEDIIDLPHHISPTRPQMSLHDRAAQFSPFAALTGHQEAVYETQRLTSKKRELDENQKAVINEKLQKLLEHVAELPEVRITYFEPDRKKEGGSYPQVHGKIKKIDEILHQIYLVNGTVISIEDIVDIEILIPHELEKI